MGLAKDALDFLLREASRRPYDGDLLTLGKQDIHFGANTLGASARRRGISLGPISFTSPAKADFTRRNLMSDTALYSALGFRTSQSIDAYEHESADLIFDLNESQVPESLKAKFDVILDSGTIEHVFHLPNVLNNLFSMLRTGGRIIHLQASSNHVDHGFYMFSPTLFWDFYSVNEFDINTFQMFRYTPEHDVAPWMWFDYTPGCLDRVSYGGFDDAMYGIACVVTKTECSTGDRIPQQGHYRRQQEALTQIPDRLAQLKAKLGNEPIIVYGAGDHTHMLFEKYHLDEFNIVRIWDKDRNKWNVELSGIPVGAPGAGIEEAKAVVVSSRAFERQIMDELEARFQSEIIVLPLYEGLGE